VAEQGGASSILGPADHTAPKSFTRVKLTTLDTLLRGRSLKGPWFLKIDVEGYDLKVLQGATETLSQCSMIMIEGTLTERQAGACKLSDILNFLEPRGWVLFDFVSLSYAEDRMLDHFDLLFVPKNSPLL